MGNLYSVNVPETIKAVVRAIEELVQRERLNGQADDGFTADSAKVTYDSLMTALGINSNDTAGRRLKEAQKLDLIELVEPPGGFGKTNARRYRVLVPSADLQKRTVGGVFPTLDAVRNAMQPADCPDCPDSTGRSAKEGGPLLVAEGTKPETRPKMLRGKL